MKSASLLVRPVQESFRRDSFQLFDADVAVFHLTAISFEVGGREFVGELQWLTVAGGDVVLHEDFDRAIFGHAPIVVS